MKTGILFSADWHLDQSNIRYTLPAVDALIELADEHSPHLVVHGGDYFVHRGSIHPEVNWLVRDRLHKLASMAGGVWVDEGRAAANLLAISGNHDQVFQSGQHDGLAGAVAAGGDADDVSRGIYGATTASGPRVFRVSTGLGGALSFILVPTINKYWLHSQTETEDKQDAGALLTSMVQSLIFAEKGAGRDPIVVYHGTVAGARLSNEQVMTAGMDVAIPQTGFNGAAVVLAGHIHHAQEMDGPGCKIHYPGSIAPLTWNDRCLEPRALLVEIEHDEAGAVQSVDVQPLMLPVVSQMIESEVIADDWRMGDTVEEILASAVKSSGASAGDRLRLKITAPGAVLSQITDNLLAQLAEKHGLEHIKAIRERSDADRIEFTADRRVGVVEAFQRWLELQARDDVGDRDREDLVTLARQLEEQVQDEHLDACYDYQPETLTAKNWCQYGDFEIDFQKLGSLVAIRGQNTAGKSNAVRALIFALYKLQIAGDVLSDLIRQGEKAAEVSHTFTSAGERYRIRRTLKRSGERGATAQLFFECEAPYGISTEGRWVPMAEGDARETEQAIRALIGPPELFLATTYAGQQDVDGLLDLGPAEFRDLLQSVLQRDFAGRQKVIRGWAAGAEKAAEKSQVLMERADVAAAEAGRLEQDLEVARRRQAEHQAEAERVDLPALEAAHRAAGEHLAELKGQLAATAGGEAGREQELRAELSDVQSRLATVRAANEELGRLNLDLEQFGPRPDVEPLRDTAARAEREHEQATEKALSAASAHHGAIEQAAARVTDLDRQLAQTKGDREAVLRDLRAAEHDARLLDEVPCEGATWTDNGHEMRGGDCQFLRRARDQKGRIDELGARAGELAQQMARLDGELTEARAELDTLRQEATRAQEQARDRRQEAADALAEARSALDTALSAASRHDDLVARIERMEAQVESLPSLGCREADLWRELSALQEAVEKRKQLEAAVAEAERAAATAADLVAAGGRRHRDAIAAAEEAAKQVAAVEARLDAARKQAAEVEFHRAAIAEQERMQRHCSVLLDALGRDGVPQLLLEQFALPELRALVNSYLEETAFEVQIDAQRQLVSGEGRPGVYLTFTDHRGVHPVSAASGQQRVALGSALRNALAALHAQALGSRIWLTIQDEGFGALDPDNRELAKLTMRRIARDRRWYIYISHVDGLSEIADSVLEAQAVNGCSRLEVVR